MSTGSIGCARERSAEPPDRGLAGGGVGAGGRFARRGASQPRVAHAPDEHHSRESGEAQQQEARAPAEPRGDRRREREAQSEPDRDAGVEDARRESEPRGREAVAEQRDGRGRQRGLADADERAPRRHRGEARGRGGEPPSPRSIRRGPSRRSAGRRTRSARTPTTGRPMAKAAMNDTPIRMPICEWVRPRSALSTGARAATSWRSTYARTFSAVSAASSLQAARSATATSWAAPARRREPSAAAAARTSKVLGCFSSTVKPLAASSFFAVSETRPVVCSSSFDAPSSAFARWATSADALSNGSVHRTQSTGSSTMRAAVLRLRDDRARVGQDLRHAGLGVGPLEHRGALHEERRLALGVRLGRRRHVVGAALDVDGGQRLGERVCSESVKPLLR